MFWGCISKNKLGPLIEVDTRLNSSNYITDILVPFLQTFWTSFKRKKKNPIFMQDNAPCHKAKAVISWFGRKRVPILGWPPQSPDLNPIENLWSLLFTGVRVNHEGKIRTLPDLKLAIREEWERIPTEMLHKLYSSLPQRMREVKKAGGYATKY